MYGCSKFHSRLPYYKNICVIRISVIQFFSEVIFLFTLILFIFVCASLYANDLYKKNIEITVWRKRAACNYKKMAGGYRVPLVRVCVAGKARVLLVPGADIRCQVTVG